MIALGDGHQLIGVLLILAGAVGYLTLYFRRNLKGQSDGKGSCGCQCSGRSECGDSEYGSSTQTTPHQTTSCQSTPRPTKPSDRVDRSSIP